MTPSWMSADASRCSNDSKRKNACDAYCKLRRESVNRFILYLYSHVYTSVNHVHHVCTRCEWRAVLNRSGARARGDRSPSRVLEGIVTPRSICHTWDVR